MKKKTKPKRRAQPKPRVRRITDGSVLFDGLYSIGEGLFKIGALVALAVLTPEDDLRDAGGSIVEAMHKHKCGPACWHAIGDTEEERQAWWDEKMRAYDMGKKAREDLFRRSS